MPKVAPQRVAAWAGRLFLMEGRALYVGPVAAAAPHAHHAVQLTIALEATLRCAVQGAPAVDMEAVLLAPDVVHAVEAPLGPVALLFMDPEGAPVCRLLETLAGTASRAWDGNLIAPALRQGLREVASRGASPSQGAALAQQLQHAVAPGQDEVRRIDRRVRRVITMLRDLADPGSDLDAAAREVGLSPDRLGHLFSEQVGLPFRPYVLWIRLQRALATLDGGASLTEAAHQAGFADSAHFSRTFRRMFGIAPSLLGRADPEV